MITPPELGCTSFLADAEKAVKAKYPDASFKEASGQKRSIKKEPMNWGYDVFYSATFRVQDSMQVIVTTKDYELEISEPEDVLLGLPDIGDLSTVKFEPWNFTADYKEINEKYSSIRLARRPINPSVNWKSPDQPFYTFSDKEDNIMGVFGATDGKTYELEDAVSSSTST